MELHILHLSVVVPIEWTVSWTKKQCTVTELQSQNVSVQVTLVPFTAEPEILYSEKIC